MHHDVRAENVDLNGWARVGVAYGRELKIRFVAAARKARTAHAAVAALIAEVVHGAPSRFSDPARSRLRLAARTGTFPVPLKTYDNRSPCCAAAWMRPSSATPTRSTA